MRSEKPNRKQIEINYETQFSINMVLKDKIEKKNNTKNNSSHPSLTHQTHDMNYEMEITS
jgi:hypothetical protein